MPAMVKSYRILQGILPIFSSSHFRVLYFCYRISHNSSQEASREGGATIKDTTRCGLGGHVLLTGEKDRLGNKAGFSWNTQMTEPGRDLVVPGEQGTATRLAVKDGQMLYHTDRLPLLT